VPAARPPPSPAPPARHRIQPRRRQLHLFVSQKAAHQLGTRIRLLILDLFGTRQQQARFDFNQHRRHQKIFRRQIKLIRFHLGDIVQILLGNLHHRNIENVDILFADKVKQQIQRPLEAA